MTKFSSTVLAAVFAVTAGAASASVTYDWTGTCGDLCTGTATATLTLSDSYTPGAALANSDFESFSFTSDAGSYTVPGAHVFDEFWAGSILPTLNGATYTFIDYPGGGTYFQTAANGNWETWIHGSYLAAGTGGTWSLRAPVSNVPVPAALPLMLAALGGIGAVARRKRKAA